MQNLVIQIVVQLLPATSEEEKRLLYLAQQIVVQLLPATSEEEKRLLYLAQLDENRRNVALAVETHAKRIKAQYDRNVTPCNFLEGDLVLLYDQANDKLGAGKFVPMWHGPYIVKRKLEKGAYELEYFDGVSLGKVHFWVYPKSPHQNQLAHMPPLLAFT